jgi:hypothetical protein
MLERPGVIGFLAPRILIPEWLFARLSPAELDQIVLHETEHLRRGDDWTNLLQKLVLILFPLSPALIWMERRLCTEREMACDEGVIRRTQAPRAYAECLASLAERGLEHRGHGLALGALSLGAWQRRPELVRRVHSILRGRSVLHPIAARSLMAVLGCGLLLGAAGLARCPQMVAFSPMPEVESTRLGRSAHYTQVVDPAFTSLRTMAVQTSAHRAQAGPYLTELKAPMPIRAQSSEMNLAGKKTESHAGPARQLADPRFSKPAVREEMLKANLSLPEAAPRADGGPDATDGQSQDANQGWIVLTAWEQVETSGQWDQMDKAHQADRSMTSDEAASQSAKQDSGQRNAQMTITRLVFRVIPVNSQSPAAGQLRTGWLVFQL